MPRKCSAINCRSGYNPTKEFPNPPQNVTVHKFPGDAQKRLAWFNALPRTDLKFEKITDNMGICSKHWPPNYECEEMAGTRGKQPKYPPSIFDCPASCIRTPADIGRKTCMAHAEARRDAPFDQQKDHDTQDFFGNDLTTFHERFISEMESYARIKKENDPEYVHEELYYFNNNKKTYSVLSKCMEGPILNFSVHFTIHLKPETNRISLTYVCFRKLEKIRHPDFTRKITRFSHISEIMRLARDKDTDLSQKNAFLCSRVYLLNKPQNVPYSREDLLLALEWMSLSKALYREVREFIPLPHETVLSKITSISNQTSDMELFKSIFSSFDERCRGVIFIIDEVYVKATISYSGGIVYGWAVDTQNNEQIPAKTMLCIMVKCFFSYEKFLAKILPCQALTASYQEEQILHVIDTMEKCDVPVIGIVLDNNRVNQKYFKSLPKFDSDEKPWIVKNPFADRPLFLIYDPVHLMKNIRNSWMTEKTKTLYFYDDLSIEPKQAKWQDLVELQEHESKNLTRMSKLTKTTLSPNNQEKQKVQLALNIFDPKTITALETSQHSNDSWKNTAMFLKQVYQLWKVFNTKSYKGLDSGDLDKEPVCLSRTRQLNILKQWDDRAKKMTHGNKTCMSELPTVNLEPTLIEEEGEEYDDDEGEENEEEEDQEEEEEEKKKKKKKVMKKKKKKKKNIRYRKLTKDTGNAIQWTCNVLQDVCKYLLETELQFKHHYVCFGFFQQDDIEHHFAHFRRASGCNYYISAQNVQQTHAIDRAILFLQSGPEYDRPDERHKCTYCFLPLTKIENDIINNIHHHIENISLDEKMVLYHIGGSIAQKNKNLCGEASDVLVENCFDSSIAHNMYVDNISAFTAGLDRGGLKYITRVFFEYILHSFAFFSQLSEPTCRPRIMKILFLIKDICEINVPIKIVDNRKLVNSLFKMYARKQTESIVTDKKKGQQRKIAKLSSKSN